MSSGDKFSLFDNATTASYPAPAGLQAGGNVLLQPDALAYAIAYALGNISRNVAMLGVLTAYNLTGTNTGDQVAATVPYTPGAIPAVGNVQDALDYLATRSSGSSAPDFVVATLSGGTL